MLYYKIANTRGGGDEEIEGGLRKSFETRKGTLKKLFWVGGGGPKTQCAFRHNTRKCPHIPRCTGEGYTGCFWVKMST